MRLYLFETDLAKARARAQRHWPRDIDWTALGPRRADRPDDPVRMYEDAHGRIFVYRSDAQRFRKYHPVVIELESKYPGDQFTIVIENENITPKEV